MCTRRAVVDFGQSTTSDKNQRLDDVSRSKSGLLLFVGFWWFSLLSCYFGYLKLIEPADE